MGAVPVCADDIGRQIVELRPPWSDGVPTALQLSRATLSSPSLGAILHKRFFAADRCRRYSPCWRFRLHPRLFLLTIDIDRFAPVCRFSHVVDAVCDRALLFRECGGLHAVISATPQVQIRAHSHAKSMFLPSSEPVANRCEVQGCNATCASKAASCNVKRRRAFRPSAAYTHTCAAQQAARFVPVRAEDH